MSPPVEKNWLIRPFCPKDKQACRQLYLDGLLGGKLSENDTGLDIDDIQAVYMNCAGNSFWVAETEAGQIVGMIGVQHHDEDIGEIRRLRVSEDFRRRGIGAALLERALKFCQEHEYLKITLDTFVSHEPAIKLFQKFNFRLSRTRRVNDKDLLYFYLDLYTGPEKERP